MDKENPRIEIGGDPEGGWLIDIHDGVNHAVYRPNGKKDTEAVAAAVKEHNDLFYPGKSAAEQMQNPMAEPEFVRPAPSDLAPASSLGLAPLLVEGPAIESGAVPGTPEPGDAGTPLPPPPVATPDPIPASEPAAPAADATVTAPT